MTSEDFFAEHGLKVEAGEVEVGGTYPIYGAITKLISEEPGNVIVELNYSIEAKLHVQDSAKMDIIRQRAFEPGIFISEVITKEPTITVNCSTVLFGKSQTAEQ